MDKPEIVRLIKARSFLSGQFVLRSGKTSSSYLDKYRFESDPKLLNAIVCELQKLLPEKYDYLAGMELGGIPLATGLSLKTGKPCLYVRKTAKEYGTCNLVEGGFETGKEAVVIEDVITTAGQVCVSIGQMRELGIVVKYVVCVIDREQGGGENIAKIGCTFHSLFTLAELDRLADNKS